MHVTPEHVEREYEWIQEQVPGLVEGINDIRAEYAVVFDTTIEPVTVEALRSEIDTVFENGPQAVNVAGLTALLRDLDVDGDYPGFIVDEVLGRELAAVIGGGQPFRLLSAATFHYVDIQHHPDEDGAGRDDLHAALVAGFQARLPGWNWTKGDSRFAVDTGKQH